jgi:hypothetical protein
MSDIERPVLSAVERKKLTLSIAGLLVTWSLTVIGAVWVASASQASLAGQVRFNTQNVSDHESRLRTLERQTSEIAADVRWIRRTLEADNR